MPWKPLNSLELKNQFSRHWKALNFKKYLEKPRKSIFGFELFIVKIYCGFFLSKFFQNVDENHTKKYFWLKIVKVLNARDRVLKMAIFGLERPWKVLNSISFENLEKPWIPSVWTMTKLLGVNIHIVIILTFISEVLLIDMIWNPVAKCHNRPKCELELKYRYWRLIINCLDKWNALVYCFCDSVWYHIDMLTKVYDKR